MIRKDTPLKLKVSKLRSAYEVGETHEHRIFLAAKWYGIQGFHIVPFGPKGYPYGYSQSHATCKLKKIEEWWDPVDGKYPGYAIALAHGGESGLCAIDLDVKADIDGVQILSDLVSAYGDYDDPSSSIDTLMAVTPSGGRHLVFRFHPEIYSNAEKFYKGIDTRGGNKKNPSKNGGITFIEPSYKPTEPTEEIYRWDDSHEDILDVPEWLVDTLSGHPPVKGIELQEAYIQSAPGLHGDGRDRNIYMDLMRFAGAGYTEEELWSLVPKILERMDPPDEGMVRKKVESVLQSDAFNDSTLKAEKKTRHDSMGLDKNKKGNPLKTSANLKKILSSPAFEHAYGDIRFDSFYGKFMIDGKPMSYRSNWAQGITFWISENIKLEYGVNTVREAMELIAEREKEHTNAARDYFMSCPPCTAERTDNYWGSRRKGPGPAFETLCTKILQLNDRNLNKNYTDEHREAYKAFIWFWLQGAVARACVPGCKVEIVLNIFGSQGIGKSTFFRDLCPDPEWFTDSLSDSIVHNNFGNKDELAKLHAKLIVEMPELSPVKSGGKAGDDKIKQFLSAQKDDMRMPFGRDVTSHYRTCVIGGTSNNNDIYRDVTGDRRFVSIDHGSKPILLGDLDKGVMADIRDRLWGEIRDSFNAGELDMDRNALLVCIPPLLRDIQSNINNTHRYEEMGVPEVIDWMSDKTRITWSEIIFQARQTPGLRDSKENAIIRLIRSALSNSPNWVFKKVATRIEADGSKRRTNLWVNTDHPLEKKFKAGFPSFPHWSTYKGAEENPLSLNESE